MPADRDTSGSATMHFVDFRPARIYFEKLLPSKFAKTKLRQDALQTTFSVFLDIFYPPNFRCFDENGVFQQPQAITLKSH